MPEIIPKKGFMQSAVSCKTTVSFNSYVTERGVGGWFLVSCPVWLYFTSFFNVYKNGPEKM